MQGIAAGGAVAEVGTQRSGERAGVRHAVHPRQFRSNEAANVFWLHLADGDGAAGEPAQQQPSHDRQSPCTRSDSQAAGVAHVHVVAVQFLRNGAAGPGQFQDDLLFTQQRQQVRKAGPQVAVGAQCGGMAVASRQVRIEELLDKGLVDLVGSQPTPCHPMGKVGQCAQVRRHGTSGVPATFQQRLECIDVRRQRAIKQPGLGHRVQ
jgi:hypothetical protein